MINTTHNLRYDEVFNSLNGINRVIVPFLACGDLSAFDSDMTYPLDLPGFSSAPKAPVQSAINPPYKQFLDLRRGVAGEKPAPPQGTARPEDKQAS